jgi:hypothetical protein
LQVEPIEINPALVSAQNRKRLYWCNWSVEQPDEKGIFLNDIFINSETTIEKSYCIISGYHKAGTSDAAIKFSKNKHRNQLIFRNRRYEKLTPIECERLQTLPDNYAEGVSNTQRYKMIGNGWTVSVIEWIFKQMKI